MLRRKMSEENNKKGTGKKIAVIRVRGKNRTNEKVNDTLDMLRLYRNNYCVLIDDTPDMMGMLKKTKDYITWGEIDAETEKLLREKKEEKIVDSEGKESAKKFFRLNPPKGGFERKGIKFQYKVGGVVGYRGDKINELIKKMI